MKSKDIKKAIEHELSKETGGEFVKTSLKTKENYQHGKHPNSLANLKPYKKGVSGNPGGRPEKFRELAKALNKWKNVKLDYLIDY